MSVAAALSRAEEDLREGNYYEAAQQYRSTFHRWVKKGQADNAVDLASEGGVQLCRHEQYQSAVGLAELIIEVYETMNTPVSSISKERLVRIVNAIPPSHAASTQLFKSIVAWTVKASGSKYGDAEIRKAFGERLWSEQQYHEGQTQFLQGDVACAERLGTLIFEWVTPSHSLEVIPLFPTRAILQYLSMKKLAEAEALHQVFLTKILTTFPAMRLAEQGTESSKIIITKLPLINFSTLLLLTVRRSSVELFDELVRKYTTHLKLEPSILELVQQVKQVYFPQPNAGGSGFSGLLQSLLGGGARGGAMPALGAMGAGGNSDDDNDVDMD